MDYSTPLVLALSIIAFVTFSASYAEVPVTIPLGASNQNNPFSLSPSALDVQVNDTVTWKNDDNSIHTVTTGKPGLGFDGRIDSGVISPGGTFSYTFGKSGVYSYYCLFHPWMTGFVNVGTSVPAMPIGILVSTDQSVYHRDDVIKITGQVSQFVENKQVTVWITDSKGTGISAIHTETRTGRDFAVHVAASGKMWIPGNNYTVYAQYGPASSVATAVIQYEPKLSSNETGQDVPTDNSAAGNHFYMSSYKKLNPDSNNYITVQTEHKIYKPDSQVKIYGSVWDGVFAQIGGGAYLATVPVSGIDGNTVAELVTIQVKDKSGNMISEKEAQTDNSGNYVASVYIPQNTSGIFYVNSLLQTKEGLLGTLDASHVVKLESSSNFLVEDTHKFSIPTSTGNYDVNVSSNSTVSNFAFDSQQKNISFDVQGTTGTRGISDVTVPKLLLGGQIHVLIDGVVQPYDSDDVIVTSDTTYETGLEINYHHSMHTIEVVGTNAAEPPVYTQTVPEFSLTPVILAASILSVLVISSKARKLCQNQI